MQSAHSRVQKTIDQQEKCPQGKRLSTVCLDIPPAKARELRGASTALTGSLEESGEIWGDLK